MLSLVCFSICSLSFSLFFAGSAAAGPLLQGATSTPYPCPTPLVRSPSGAGCVMATSTPNATSTAVLGGASATPDPLSGTTGALINTATAYAGGGPESCPGGAPYGYGVITPDPMWLYRCGHCLQSLEATVTPYPCPTPYLTNGSGECYLPTPGTPLPTSTPDPSSPDYVVSFDSEGYTDYSVVQGSVVFEGNPSPSVNTVVDRFDGASGSDIDSLTVDVNVPDGCTLSRLDYEYRFDNGIQFDGLTEHSRLYDSGDTLLYTMVNGHGSYGFEDTWLSSSWGSLSGYDTDYVRITMETHTGASIGYVQLDNVALFCVEDFEPEPTATADGSWNGYTPPGYCDVIFPRGTPYDNPNNGVWGGAPGMFEAPQFSLGEPECVTYEAWTFELSDYGFDGDYEWPGIQLCVIPFSLGSMVIVGLKINLDLIMGSMAAMGVMKWFIAR